MIFKNIKFINKLNKQEAPSANILHIANSSCYKKVAIIKRNKLKKKLLLIIQTQTISCQELNIKNKLRKLFVFFNHNCKQDGSVRYNGKIYSYVFYI